ncbi:hypothetical protein [Lysinibacillus sp. NPDC093216]|uniref:hypothetical protein n=1 Tax=Lysinibacillus sp. NPDC093216 TaxID=3390576 RepID=UPI003CFCC279
MTNIVLLPLPLRFRAKAICCCRFAFAQKPSAAAALLSRKSHLLLPLCFRADKTLLLPLR